MKRPHFPLRGDHNLLTPEPHSSLGINVREQVTLEGGASVSRHLSDLSSRCQTSASPNRRLRFEDETEKEAESRYLERQFQRGRVGLQGTSVLASKLDINQSINIRLGHRGAEHDADQQQRGRTLMSVARSIESGGVMFGGRAQQVHHLSLHPTLNEVERKSLKRPHLHVRTELLKESYIGCITPADSGDGEGGAVNKHVTWRASTTGINGNQGTTSPGSPTAENPINPYGTYKVRTLPQPSTTQHHAQKCIYSLTPLTVTSQMMSENGRLNNIMKGKDLNQNQEEQKKLSATEHHRESQIGLEVNRRQPCSTSAEDNAPPTSGSADRSLRHPIREELHSAVSLPERFSRDGPSCRSLRRLFSSIKLGTTRSSSLDRRATKPRLPVADHGPKDDRKSCSLLKKSPSAQSVCVGAQGLQMKKSSSLQSFGSEKSRNRCADCRAADEQ